MVRPHVRGRPAARRCARHCAVAGPANGKTGCQGQGRKEQGQRRARAAKATGSRVRRGEGRLRTREKALRKAHTRDSLQALSKLGELVDGRYRIVSQPPVVVPLRELAGAVRHATDERRGRLHEQFREYRATLQDDRRHLLERFEIIDMARKVVGVGSVGTRAFIVLLQGRDEQDPLFLQVKEATRSVLEDHLPKSRYHNPGERVVQGQRMMQAASDIYLGWTKGVQADRYFYWRQLRDMKVSALVDTMPPSGWTSTRAVRVDAGPRARPVRRPGRDGRIPRRPATSSTGRSPTSPSGTPTRTNWTTRHSPPPCSPAGSRPSRAFDGRSVQVRAKVIIRRPGSPATKGAT